MQLIDSTWPFALHHVCTFSCCTQPSNMCESKMHNSLSISTHSCDDTCTAKNIVHTQTSPLKMQLSQQKQSLKTRICAKKNCTGNAFVSSLLLQNELYLACPHISQSLFPFQNLHTQIMIGDQVLVLKLHVGLGRSFVIFKPSFDCSKLISETVCCEMGIFHDFLKVTLQRVTVRELLYFQL